MRETGDDNMPHQPRQEPVVVVGDLSKAPMRPFRVLITSAGFEPGFRGGGPIRSVARIVDTVSAETELWLVTRDRDLGSREPYPGLSGQWIRRGRSSVYYLDTRSPGQWLGALRDLRALPLDVLYVNSLWNPCFTMIPVIAARLGLLRAKRVLLAPRGELSPGALAVKRHKKRLFLTWWGPLLRSMNVVWHATSEHEASDIRAVFPRARLEVNANQVALPHEPLAAVAAHDGPVRLVFIGRISVMKNLDLTLSTLAGLSKPVEFDIFGPVEDTDYWSKCKGLMTQTPAHVRVRYGGELAPTEVRRTFSEYDAFVFPTRGENFGHIIAESMSASCPVVCSDKTPWTPVLIAGGGAVAAQLTVESLGSELERFAAMTPSERLRARQAAGNAYRSWRVANDGPNILDQVRRSQRVFSN
jgi:glycosyltransferase involved in cell wall biosynthesis